MNFRISQALTQAIGGIYAGVQRTVVQESIVIIRAGSNKREYYDRVARNYKKEFWTLIMNFPF